MDWTEEEEDLGVVLMYIVGGSFKTGCLRLVLVIVVKVLTGYFGRDHSNNVREETIVSFSLSRFRDFLSSQCYCS